MTWPVVGREVDRDSRPTQDEHRWRQVPSDGSEQELQAFEKLALRRIDPIVRRPNIEPCAAIDLGKSEAAT